MKKDQKLVKVEKCTYLKIKKVSYWIYGEEN